jgi:hypothetical protein
MPGVLSELTIREAQAPRSEQQPQPGPARIADPFAEAVLLVVDTTRAHDTPWSGTALGRGTARVGGI